LIRQYKRYIDTKKAKGATATLVLKGEVAMIKGYGYADELLNVKNDGNPIGFRIGSISKTFVALAALIAVLGLEPQKKY